MSHPSVALEAWIKLTCYSEQGRAWTAEEFAEHLGCSAHEAHGAARQLARDGEIAVRTYGPGGHGVEWHAVSANPPRR